MAPLLGLQEQGWEQQPEPGERQRVVRVSGGAGPRQRLTGHPGRSAGGQRGRRSLRVLSFLHWHSPLAKQNPEPEVKGMSRVVPRPGRTWQALLGTGHSCAPRLSFVEKL